MTVNLKDLDGYMKMIKIWLHQVLLNSLYSVQYNLFVSEMDNFSIRWLYYKSPKSQPTLQTPFSHSPGGIYEGELDSPAAQEAVKQALVEFQRRAVRSGRLGSSDTVLVGDVLDVKTQV